MNEAEMKAAAALEDVCRYLAACYYEPDPAFEEERMFSSLVDAAALADARLVLHAERLAAAFRTATLDELLLDYTRLFLGPTGVLANPYGSFWLEGNKTLMGDSTVAVQGLYREAGFDVDEAFHDLPDHVAVELEFLYALMLHLHAARFEGNEAETARLQQVARRFLSGHLGAWIEPLAAAMEASAQTEFYRCLGRATVECLSLARSDLADGTATQPLSPA